MEHSPVHPLILAEVGGRWVVDGPLARRLHLQNHAAQGHLWWSQRRETIHTNDDDNRPPGGRTGGGGTGWVRAVSVENHTNSTGRVATAQHIRLLPEYWHK